MRAIWKGAITFGLVNVPVKIYSATEDHDIALHQVHDRDGGRIRYQRKCEVCGEVVSFDHIDKAYDDGEHTVVLTKDELKALPEERDREIDVVQFVPSDQVDPIMFDRAYILEPDSSSPKAYVLLRRTLEQTDRTAIVEFALRQKTRLAALRVRGKLLMLQTLLWADEVREVEFPSLEGTTRIAARELEMSSHLVDSYSEDFDASKFTDAYQEELRTLIDAKIEQGDALDTAATFGEKPEEEGGGEVLDLMEALKRSVERSRGAKGDPKGDDDAPAKTSTAKRSSKAAAEDDAEGSGAAAKKPAAEKPAAKKAPAKKDAAKKPAAKRTAAKSDEEKAAS
ncbi:non-homologous end joining protein Ku [Rathayibacter sp. VKM Ac-2630]|uniref:non-homologous end joining protein Ku n=1 Tax=Rathayibacter sp. VKM Ac-2630 TaxID=1938617 RepID=UPI000981204C|nr:Ku protein [Rathayibacter sp. VKM Ac-2630]OOB90419.1 Ku protein [Rathayibacter sp. VKM Ac-2630]